VYASWARTGGGLIAGSAGGGLIAGSAGGSPSDVEQHLE
jgi:hypothetical protein